MVDECGHECEDGVLVEPSDGGARPAVVKGERIGMFHNGGSTHLLISRPGVDITFDLHGQTPGLNASNIHVKDGVAEVR